MLTIGLYGISDPRGLHRTHDHAIAVMQDGHVLTCMELERITGRKHDNRLGRFFDALIAPWVSPGEAIRFVQANSFLGGRFATDSGSLIIEEPDGVLLEASLQPSRIRVAGPHRELKATAFTISHELAHIGSCLPFHGAPPSDSLLVHIDGGASVSACSVWLWDGRSLRHLHSSWDEMKRAVNNFNDSALSAQILGLDLADHLSMPGKLMGLAAFGQPRNDTIAWLDDHGFFLETRWRGVDLCTRLARAFGSTGGGRDPSRSRLHQDVAATLQRFFEERVLEYLRRWKKLTGAKHLYYAGGAALNVLANTRIEHELGFETVSIPPAPSDCGLALGAAAMAEWLEGRLVPVTTPYLTRTTPGETGTLDRPTPMPGATTVARDLAAGKIVATVLGAAEVGPRALGHRSLLARPDSVALRRRLSEGLKQREWYRPVAPVMLPEVACACLQNYRPSGTLGAYMLGAWSVLPEYRERFAGCLHADGTVRAQVVDRSCPAQAPLAEVLQILLREYGVYGLINTSLNGRGEPMLDSMAAAVAQATRLGADQVWTDSGNGLDDGSSQAGKSRLRLRKGSILPAP